jgi:hypothetical protein
MLAPALNRTARDAAYLTVTLLSSVLAFTVWVTALTLSLTFAILIIGLPVIIGSAYVMRWTAELDRQNAALVPVALASALLAIPLAWITVWTLRGMAKLHASLAVELLGRY